MKSYRYILVNHDRNHSQTDKSVVHLQSGEVNYSNLRNWVTDSEFYQGFPTV